MKRTAFILTFSFLALAGCRSENDSSGQDNMKEEKFSDKNLELFTKKTDSTAENHPQHSDSLSPGNPVIVIDPSDPNDPVKPPK